MTTDVVDTGPSVVSRSAPVCACGDRGSAQSQVQHVQVDGQLLGFRGQGSIDDTAKAKGETGDTAGQAVPAGAQEALASGAAGDAAGAGGASDTAALAAKSAGSHARRQAGASDDPAGCRWADGEQQALARLRGEGAMAQPQVPTCVEEAAAGARRERRTVEGSTKRERAGDDPQLRAGHRAQARPVGAAWGEVLILFAGPGGERDLPARLGARGLAVTAIDTKLGGAEHNVLRPAVGGALLRRVQRGDFDAVFLATPCSSYSVAHRPQLRSRRQPDGLRNAPAEWLAYLAKHNALARWSADVIRAAVAVGALWALENPADRGDRDSPAWWPKFNDHAPIWLNTAVARALREVGASKRTFAQCSFGAPTQKYTTIAHTPDMDEAMAPLDSMACRHGNEPHQQRAHGRDRHGRSRAAEAAAYPPRMNDFLAEAIAETLRRRRDLWTPMHRSRGLSGGRAADGPGLFEPVAEACESARYTAPRFASLRNKREADAQELALEALPGDLHEPVAHTRPGRRGAAAQPGGEVAAELSELAESDAVARAALRADRLARGPVAIGELFGGDVYQQVVLPWLQLADAAGEALRDGRQPPAVPTVTVTQDQMTAFARDVVWDCADPTDCRPVVRSTRRTAFPGRRQIDRAAVRRIAALLRWHDDDIIAQIGEGGAEARSDCPLDTVLAFHHAGVTAHFADVAKVIGADTQEEWVSRPTRHLPFVPCRVLPRNVMMQERARWHSDGDGRRTLELYLKPRVTQNSSYGDEDSVNAGVPADDRAITLPTVQAHGRASAICDTAGEVGGARAARYVVDAESAFRFCPVQLADQWTQCFCWWGDGGEAGFAIDRRLGFGGAYAPNRFERISTLCAAYVQYLQAAFDREHPLPASARRWSAARAEAQRRGDLTRGEAQLAPRHLQVYIDDFCGSALDDPVQPPASVQGVVIDPENTGAVGGQPALPGTRVYVHAQLTVLGLAALGLSASPSKVVVGDPTVGLGFQLVRDEQRLGGGRLRCPELKRAALLRAIQAHVDAARAGRVERREAETTVGRLCNMSQAFPELKVALHGGYALTKVTWHAGGRRRRLPELELRDGSEASRNWLELLDLAAELLATNDGVPLAAERSFSARTAPGALTVVTDASGKDGVGGYAFDAAEPDHVVLVAEQWPTDIQQALDRAASGEAGLSMPAAEAFGQWAVAAAAAQVFQRRPTTITAVGDCAPAACAINAASSGNAQMRRLVRAGRELSEQWLAVAVPREWNLDADRLSHPSNLPQVTQEAVAAGLRVTVVGAHGDAVIPAECWEALREAVVDGLAATRGRRRKAQRAQPRR